MSTAERGAWRLGTAGDEAGSISLEFAGTLFMYLMVVLVALQGLLSVFAVTQANSAARNAARAEVLHPGSGAAAGRNAVAAPLRTAGTKAHCSGGGGRGDVTCSVTVTTPLFNLTWMPNWVPKLTVTRKAVQPDTEVR